MKISLYRIIVITFCALLFSACTLVPSQEEINAARINTDLGLHYLHQDNTILAKEKFILALKENPKDPDVNDAWGYFLETTGAEKDAEHYYLDAISFAEFKGMYQNNYGTYLYRQGRYSESMTQFLLATEDANYLFLGHAYKNAGMAALKLGSKESAKTFFAKAKKNDPKISIPNNL